MYFYLHTHLFLFVYSFTLIYIPNHNYIFRYVFQILFSFAYADEDKFFLGIRLYAKGWVIPCINPYTVLWIDLLINPAIIKSVITPL